MFIDSMKTDLTTNPTGWYGEMNDRRNRVISPLEKTYRENDIKIFTDPKISELYKSKNKPSINKFEFILAGLEQYSGFSSQKVSLSEIDDKFGKKDPEVTRIIFNKNWAKDFYPFTRWILAHRTFHALQIPICNSVTIQLIDDFVSKIEALQFGDNVSVLNKTSDLSIRPHCKEEDNIKIRFIRSVFKFRSAKYSDRLINLDLYSELFAQYQISGRVSFNRTDNDDINELMEEFEPIINSMFDDICNKANKGTFIF